MCVFEGGYHSYIYIHINLYMYLRVCIYVYAYHIFRPCLTWQGRLNFGEDGFYEGAFEAAGGALKKGSKGMSVILASLRDPSCIFFKNPVSPPVIANQHLKPPSYWTSEATCRDLVFMWFFRALSALGGSPWVLTACAQPDVRTFCVWDLCMSQGSYLDLVCASMSSW